MTDDDHLRRAVAQLDTVEHRGVTVICNTAWGCVWQTDTAADCAPTLAEARAQIDEHLGGEADALDD